VLSHRHAKSLLPVGASVAVVLLAVGACAPRQGVCPPLVEYTPLEWAQALSELARLDSGTQIETMLDDYQTLRVMIRACPD
jgi:hypothetical protein